MTTGVDLMTNITTLDSLDRTKFFKGLIEYGCSFIGRYYNVDDPSKNLTQAEAQMITSNGFGTVAIWKKGNTQTQTIYDLFNYNQGFSSGSIACYQASSITNQPSGRSPIYFAVDFDYSSAQIVSNIIPYFQGVNDAFKTLGDGALQYPIGIYGSDLVCNMVAAQNLATYFYKAGSPGWQTDPNSKVTYNILQSPPPLPLALSALPVGVDYDTSPYNNEGSFTVF